MTTERERLDFLARCVKESGGASFELQSEYRDHPGWICLFTVPSQHVYAITLRGAIDAAIKAAIHRKPEGQ